MAGDPKTSPSEPAGLWDRPMRPGRPHDPRSDEQRLNALEELILLPYPRATRIRSEILKLTRQGRQKPFAGAMIAGPRANGRTALAHQIVGDLSDKAWLMQMPTRASLDEFWLALLDKAKSYARASKPRSAECELEAHRALNLAASAGLKCIILDACENLLEVSANRRRLMLHGVANAWDASNVPIVLIGTPKLASIVLAERDRVGLVDLFLLPTWRLDAEFLDLLEMWEGALPLLRPSRLVQRELAMRLYALCDGLLGVLAAVLTKAAAAAILTGQERISVRLLDEIGFEVPESFRGFVF